MSQFRDTLKQYFYENDINVVHLSKQCGIERTTIQHMIGNRKEYKLPSFEVVKTVLGHLRMTPGERKHIEELFTIEKIGMHNYMGRKYVKSIVEQIASLNSNPSSGSRLIANSRLDFSTIGSLLKGSNSVNSIIYSVCIEETELNSEPNICLNTPFTYSYLKQTLLQLCWEMEGRLKIEHIVMLNKSPRVNANPNTNLEKLSEILPFAFCVGQGYQAHYYYSDLDPTNELLLSMPYYLITSHKMLLISSDFTTAILINDKQIIKDYTERFIDNFYKASRLIQYLNTPLEVIKEFSNCFSEGCQVHTFEAQPCLVRFLSEDVIRARAQDGAPEIDAIINVFITYIKSLSELSMADYFSREGLETFVESGRLAILPEAYIEPFSVQERIELLDALCGSICNGGKTRLIDSSKLYIPDNTSIQAIENGSLQLYSSIYGALHYCCISESTIVNSFIDFFESLADTNMVYSANETFTVLTSYIEILKNGL